MTLLDPLLPYEGKFSAGVKLLVLRHPDVPWRPVSAESPTWSPGP